jgi:hypothetical protein
MIPGAVVRLSPEICNNGAWKTIQPVQAIGLGGAMCIVQLGQSYLFAQRTSHKVSVDRALSSTGLEVAVCPHEAVDR